MGTITIKIGDNITIHVFSHTTFPSTYIFINIHSCTLSSSDYTAPLTGHRLASIPTVKSVVTAVLKCKCRNIILCLQAGKLIFHATEKKGPVEGNLYT